MLSFLPKLQSASQRLAGFTMIELLIVITILGILATAVLSAINPIEQINRGRDTGSRSDAEQLLSAIDRYNAFQQYYPWQNGQSDTQHLGLALTKFTADAPTNTRAAPCKVADLLSAGDGAACVGANELKSSFVKRITSDSSRSLFVYRRGGAQGDSTYVCFVPQSGAFVTEAKKRCAEGYPNDVDTINFKDVVCDASGARSSIDKMGAFAGQGEAICLP